MLPVVDLEAPKDPNVEQLGDVRGVSNEREELDLVSVACYFKSI